MRPGIPKGTHEDADIGYRTRPQQLIVYGRPRLPASRAPGLSGRSHLERGGVQARAQTSLPTAR